jgi:hypothetical protein
MPDKIAEMVMETSKVGLRVNYNELVKQLASMVTSSEEDKLKLISQTLSDAMNTLIKHSNHKSVDIKHKLTNYFKDHINKSFPHFFLKLQKELQTESPGYADLLRTIFPKWIDSEQAREILEAQTPSTQCNIARRPWYTLVNNGAGKMKKRGCWICGHILHLWNSSKKGKNLEGHGPQCEHKSPVLLALLHYQLIQLPAKLYEVSYPKPLTRSLNEVVLEWSCVLCNMVKNGYNLIYDNKIQGRYEVNEDGVNRLIADIQSKLGKINLGKTIAKKAEPPKPLWDGNSLFLSDDDYKEAVRTGISKSKAKIEYKSPVINNKITEQDRTAELDNTFTIKKERIDEAREQFESNKPNVHTALQELANISNEAITHLEHKLGVSPYQSYEIYTLLISVRLICNIHEGKLIHFMIEALDNPTKNPKMVKATNVKATTVTAKKVTPKKKGGHSNTKQQTVLGNRQRGGATFRDSLNGASHGQLDFVLEHFETIITARFINTVEDRWFNFTDWMELCILEYNYNENPGQYTERLREVDDKSTFDYIHHEFLKNVEDFKVSLIESIQYIYENFESNFEIINNMIREKHRK